MKSVYTWIVVILTGLVPNTYGQTITSLTPNSGTIGQTVDVLIRGVNTHFQQNISKADFGQGIIIRNLRISNPLTATATIQITNNASPGLTDVTITTGNEIATAFNGFEVYATSGSFNANIVVVPVETISLSNLDLTQPRNTPIMFFVNVSNDNVKRFITIKVTLSSDSRGRIGTMITSSRVLEPNAFLRITNREFSDVDINGSTGYDFLDIVRNIGTFPPGNYLYHLEVIDDQGNILVTDDGVNVVTNTNYNPELIWPGADFSMNLEELSTPYPVFQWFGQLDKYDFYLFELLDGQTPQEAIRNIAVYQQKDIRATSLVYPVSAEKLVDGKKYAWYIQGKISTAKGEQSLPSQPFRFIYKDAAGTDGNKLISKIEITPNEANLKNNQKLQFNAVFYDNNGNVVQVVNPQWNVTPDKGYVTQNGLFTAGADAGTVAIVVKAGQATEYAVVNIGVDITGDEMPRMDDMLKKLFGLPDK